MVTYIRRMTDDRVFKALADPTRRFLLDRLFERSGRTLTELESDLEMTRFGVMKHLRILEDAGLVVSKTSRAREAAFPQRRSDPAHPRPMDRQVHRASRVGAH
jgi:DNA-binding transcriptional ArsR family regulator